MTHRHPAIMNIVIFFDIDCAHVPHPIFLQKEFLGVDKFLDLWSLKNHDLYCLSYLFTYRDFNDGVLGLAFVGSTSSSTAGGICEKNTQFSNGKRKSLNTGVVSFLNYGQDVPQPVSRITFAHELGHNFGSPHDVTPDCAPGGNNGNFIMYFRATTGREFNNDKFSTCSRSSIGAVIAAKGQGTGGCFLGEKKTLALMSLEMHLYNTSSNVLRDASLQYNI